MSISTLGRYLPVLLVCVNIGCGDDPEYPPAQTVERLYVLPKVVHVAPGDAVTLQARLLGYRDKIVVLPEYVRDTTTGLHVTVSEHTVDWKFTQPANGIAFSYLGTSPAHHRVQVSVAAGIADGTTAVLEARANGKSDKVKILVLQSASSATLPSPSDGMELLAEDAGTGSTTGVLRAYSPSLQANEVASATATSGTDLMREHGLSFYSSFSAPPAGGSKVQRPVRFWIATHGILSDGSACDSVCKLKRHVAEDLEVANDIYEKNRTGIAFVNVDPGTIHELPGLADFTSRDCTEIWNEIDASTWPIASEMSLQQLHVVYSQGKTHDARGLECTKSDGTGLLVVFVTARAPTTLAHELGHALSMNYRTGQSLGHPTSGDVGFDVGNLMWTGLDMRQATDRGRILVGQSAWMNIDEISFLNLVPGLRPLLPREDCENESEKCVPFNLRMETAQ